MHLAATGAMHGHSLLYLSPAPLDHLSPTDRTRPDAPAGLQPTVACCLVVLGLPHLHVLVVGANSQAFGSPGIREDVSGNRLKREAFHPSRHGIFRSGS